MRNSPSTIGDVTSEIRWKRAEKMLTELEKDPIGFDFLSFIAPKATADCEIRKWRSRLKVRLQQGSSHRRDSHPVSGEEALTREGISPTVS